MSRTGKQRLPLSVFLRTSIGYQDAGAPSSSRGAHRRNAPTTASACGENEIAVPGSQASDPIAARITATAAQTRWLTC